MREVYTQSALAIISWAFRLKSRDYTYKVPQMKRIHLEAQVTDPYASQRLDQALAALFPDYSRSQWQGWIKNGKVQLNGQLCTKAKEKVNTDDKLELDCEIEVQGDWEAEQIPLNIVYEDDQLLVINKPAGLVVHPGAGNPQGTLVNALLYYLPELNTLPRAGIVHRLDKETTGLLVVAKTLTTHTYLTRALQKRLVKREYEAVVRGKVISGGTITAPVGRHPHRRTAMAVVNSGREAVTHYRVSERFKQHTRLLVQLETGRTHQIRVHMAHILHPIVGDPLYGKKQLLAKIDDELQQYLMHFKRQALHALRLELIHPVTQEVLSFEAPLPDDIQELLAILRKNEI